MVIPDYQSLMAPTLSALRDGLPHHVADIRDVLAERLDVSHDERQVRQASGPYLFNGRVSWSLTYLMEAGLIARPSRGTFTITQRGLAVLADHGDRVNNTMLTHFPEFTAFLERSRDGRRAAGPVTTSPAQPLPGRPSRPVATEQTVPDVPPAEAIAAAVFEANAVVSAQLLARIRESDPSVLERLVLELLTAMGYGSRGGVSEHLGRSGDGGVDGVINQDPLGLDQVYVQAKRYAADRTIGRPDIQAFVGALYGFQASRGVFITTSRFSQEARDYAERVGLRVIIIDGDRLSDLLLAHDIGVQTAETYVVKELDENWFE